MRSITDICNLALSQIGDIVITDINDKSDSTSRLCKINYEETLRELLERFDWSFAINKILLTKVDIEDNSFGFKYKYAIPHDFMRILYPKNTEYSIIRQGNYFYSNNNNAGIVYISYIDNPYNYTASFTKCMALFLASNLALPLKASPDIANYLNQKSLFALKNAISDDVEQSYNVEILMSNEIKARTGNGFTFFYDRNISYEDK
jgi:hypothetical protein